MIVFEALEFVRRELNAFLKPEREGQDKAVLSSVVMADGAVPPDAESSVVMTLINIEREGAASGPHVYARTENGAISKLPPTLNLNLYVLVTGLHQRYDDALKLLSNAIAFFQARPVFTAENVPAIAQDDSPMPFPAGLHRLTFEVFNLQLQDLSHLWGALGAKHQPSIIYKVRMLTFQEAWASETLPPIAGGESKLSS